MADKMKSTQTGAPSKTLYDSLGGEKAIGPAVEEFYRRVLDDSQLKPFFARTNMDWLKQSQKTFLSQALGGPALYKGASMRDAHGHLGIRKEDFQRVAEHLAGTLQSMAVPQPLINEVIGAVGQLAPEIITKES